MYRVLLVEDEEIIRKGIRYSVPWEECGCSVVGEAENGAAGEEKTGLNEYWVNGFKEYIFKIVGFG